eukprot:TRINITY_DN4379_c0_g1_i5.p1 TRINITY_DN4379_c0_g1~~TRINITY_DN4379_c0_g1_i5.p1  ORF type:complete len:335 (-),score=93.04 TRINITY_DN4379_c0_g1_i5:17-1021(-)
MCIRDRYMGIALKDNVVCLFGGIGSSEETLKGGSNIQYLSDMYILSLDDGFWTQPSVGGYAPLPRASPSIAGNQSEVACQVLVLGGRLRDGTVDYSLHVLEEIDPNKGDVWLVGGTAANEMNRISAELAQAEKTITEQKERIGELETMVRKVRDEWETKETKKKQLKAAIDEVRAEREQKMKEMALQVDERQHRMEHNRSLMDNLKRLVYLEKKRRKLMATKVKYLQGIFKNSENLLITTDSFLVRAIFGDLLDGHINEEVITKLANMKSEHRNQIVAFKDAFDLIHKREDSFKMGLATHKRIVKEALPDFKANFGTVLNDEERKILNFNTDQR